MFSGLNLAFFSLGRLRLEIEASAGNVAATRVLSLRMDSNFLLTSILWGDDVIDFDIIIVWGANRRIITGPDVLGRLLRGITKVVPKR